MAFRNERFLYQRKCGFSDENILSLYPPTSPYIVYEQSIWHSDKWDSMDYGRDFDFERPFFEQFHELSLDVPCISLHNNENENSEYCNSTNNLKNCYLCFNTGHAEDFYYCNTTGYGRDCMDMFWSLQNELCYECTKVHKSYHSFFCFQGQNLTDCYFCEDCRSCTNCFGCTGLRQKEYCIYNKSVGKEKYEAFMQDFEFTNESIAEEQKKVMALRLHSPHKNLEIHKSEDSVGDYIENSKNCRACFDVMNSENCKYVWDGIVNNSYDCFNTGIDTNFIYYSLAIFNSNNVRFSNKCGFVSDVDYSYNCTHSEKLFGCNGLTRKKYCILNKQYTREEYEVILPRIIEYMKSTGEWCEFFPGGISHVDYNDTLAHEYFPLDRTEALTAGFNWNDYEKPTVNSGGENVKACELCKKPFKMVAQELKFYKKTSLPKPDLCPDCRHWKRKSRINPRKLWDRKCCKCEGDVKSTYSPERPEIVYCEPCYLAEIY